MTDDQEQEFDEGPPANPLMSCNAWPMMALMQGLMAGKATEAFLQDVKKAAVEIEQVNIKHQLGMTPFDPEGFDHLCSIAGPMMAEISALPPEAILDDRMGAIMPIYMKYIADLQGDAS